MTFHFHNECGSVGIGRRARLRILCSLRTCGFKSHLPHQKISLNDGSQEWRNWQTRRLQVPVVAISCGFKSHLLHFLFAGSLESEGFPLFHFLYFIYCKINSAAFSIPIFPVSIQRSYSLPSPQRVAVHCS